MKKSIIVLFIVIGFSSCDSSKDKSVNVNKSAIKINIVLNNDHSRPELPTEEVFANHKYVQLETSKECLIGEIKKVIVKDKMLYMLDEKAKQLLVFTIDGEFIKKIGKEGRGPGEFISLDDFCFHKSDIVILARDQKELMIFHQSGTFRDVVKLDSYYTNISAQGNQVFLFGNYSLNDGFWNIAQYDIEKKKLVSKFHKYKENQAGQSYSSTTFASDNENMFCFFPNDYSIYRIVDSKCRPYIEIDFGNRSLPEGSKDMNYDELSNFKTDKNIIGRINNLLVMEDWIHFTYIDRMIQCSAFIHKKDNERVFYGTFFGSSSMPLVSGDYIGTFRNGLISVIHPSSYTSAKKYGSPEVKASLKTLCFTYEPKPSDNPIILFQELKK